MTTARQLPGPALLLGNTQSGRKSAAVRPLCRLFGILPSPHPPLCAFSPQVFQSISKDIMQRLAATQDQPSAGGQANTLRVGDKPGGAAGKKAACCSS